MRSVDAWMAGIFWLILIYLVFVKGWHGANTLLSTTLTGSPKVIKQLQGN